VTVTTDQALPEGFTATPLPTPEHVTRVGAQLAWALAAVQQALPRIRKDQTANAGQYSYSYADLASVSAELLPLLGEYGLSFTAWPMLVDGKLVLRYYLLHKSGESMTGDYPLKGGTPQQLGSEITYARRYCLCAVTGVAPDDDDDAAAAEGAKVEQQVEQRAEVDRERHAALDAVRGAWFNQYGEWNGTAAADMFEGWSHGGKVAEASAQQLRAFAAYLHTLPAADAGSDPQTEQPADQGTAAEDDDRPLTRSKRDNAHMFVLFEKLGLKDNRQGQLEYLRAVLERDIGSRSEVKQSDWPRLRAALEADVKEAEATGLAPAVLNGDA
jgi:hypothetical protein